MKRLMLISLAAIALLAGCSKDEGGGKNPQPVSVWDGTATPPEDLDATTKTATIKRASDLAWLSEQSNASVENTFEGWTFTLGANLDLAGKEWTTIAHWTQSNQVFFKGTFDGAGYTISGLNVDAPDQIDVGLFGITQGARIRNLTVSGTVRGQKQIGGICANAQAATLIENCSFSGTIESGSHMGGICGYIENSTQILGCHTSATIIYHGSNEQYAGGIVGAISRSKANQCAIRNCSFSGKFEKGSDPIADQAHFGGIVGVLNDSEVTGCKNTGEVKIEWTNTTYVGGIVGLISDVTPYLGIAGCYNTGEIATHYDSDGYTGGIAGDMAAGIISACYNTGIVTPSLSEDPDNNNFEICYWTDSKQNVINCYYAAEKPAMTGGIRFSAEQWPDGTRPGWFLGNDPDQGKFWKALGTPGSTDYPKLWWE